MLFTRLGSLAALTSAATASPSFANSNWRRNPPAAAAPHVPVAVPGHGNNSASLVNGISYITRWETETLRITLPHPGAGGAVAAPHVQTTTVHETETVHVTQPPHVVHVTVTETKVDVKTEEKIETKEVEKLVTSVVEKPITVVQTSVVEKPVVKTSIVEKPVIKTSVVEKPVTVTETSVSQKEVEKLVTSTITSIHTSVVEKPVVKTSVVEKPVTVVHTSVVEKPVVSHVTVEHTVTAPAPHPVTETVHVTAPAAACEVPHQQPPHEVADPHAIELPVGGHVPVEVPVHEPPVEGHVPVEAPAHEQPADEHVPPAEGGNGTLPNGTAVLTPGRRAVVKRW
ncbi:hypothetical protein ACRE_078490 [Hapsidospora chrysogenum ATCC 11550]|uniref:Zonadhesin-like protein n=1 Tax=Hapsidospora chrysogenum (strain ATCC 11550 / CBS 779.69 / DSM 880 / IAM 14645 / JCM 23072 / IMI 49137) TaxID=857340 RepID=A0A086SWD7_HAPC1|nr:hypothetical protein ACRE_078490 [Hapsidospora chrysogenum ATCC 11550]